MIVQNPVVESSTHQISELSGKLRQLRRLKVHEDGPPVSWHLNSAMQAAQQSAANKTKLDPTIFIGIILPNESTPSS